WFTDYRIVNHSSYQITDDFSVKNIFSYAWGSSFANPYSQINNKLIVNRVGNPRNTDPSKNATTWSDEIQFFAKLFGRVDLTSGVFTNQTYSHPSILFGQSSAFPTIDSASVSKTSSRNW